MPELPIRPVPRRLHAARTGIRFRPHRRARVPLSLFVGRSNPELGQQIARRLGVRLGRVELETFSSGEIYCRYAESIRGSDVFLVQSGSFPANEHLLELLVMIDAARLASAHHITAVVPVYPYARQDKKSAPREPITARLVATLLEAAGADRVLTMDLHSGQIQGFFSIPVDHMTALPLFARHFRGRGLSGAGVVSVSPDLGRAKSAQRFGQMLDSSFAVVTKVRPRHEIAIAREVVGDVAGKAVLLGDDMIVTGGTLIAATDAVLAAGATTVHAFATHALFAPRALESLTAGKLTDLTVTDTVRLDRSPLPDKVTVLTVADLLAGTIERVSCGRSVSALFAGENELF